MAYLVKPNTWFDGANGNTYHRVIILDDDFEEIADSGMCYGYDEQYKVTTFNELKELGVIGADERYSWRLLDEMGVEFSQVTEHKTQRQLKG
jgi:hypothetical protein